MKTEFLFSDYIILSWTKLLRNKDAIMREAREKLYARQMMLRTKMI